MKRGLFAVAIAGIILSSNVAYSAAPPDSWDGLVKVKSKRLDLAYLQPGADFRGYTKVMLDPTEVAFHKNWQREYNSSSRDLGSRVSDRDIQEALVKGVAASNEIFAQAWSSGGYQVVAEPGPDVLRIKTGVVNITVNAPDVQSSSRGVTLAPEAGHATFFLEARDSLTGALLGRAVDQRYAGDYGGNWRTSASNRGDFRDLVTGWARDGVNGLNNLKALSPIRP